MGIKLIILLALLVGVLYSLHLLVKDYQALTAARLLRFLFKRDVSSQNHPKPSVRWRRILYYDPIQCARYVYCDLGAQPTHNEVRRGFVFMLSLEPNEDDKPALEVFKQAFQFGRSLKLNETEKCRQKYHMCPFTANVLFNLIEYLIQNKY